jgi:hypothetical protein
VIDTIIRACQLIVKIDLLPLPREPFRFLFLNGEFDPPPSPLGSNNASLLTLAFFHFGII